MTLPHEVGFGRRPEADPRNSEFPVRELARARKLTLRSYTWRNPIRLDQGQRGTCVGNAFAHEAAARPVMVANVDEALAIRIYDRAQLLDQWAETPPEEGTSVIAGAKAAKEFGYVTEYRWATSFDDLCLAVGNLGPVVLGLDWYADMMDTDASGYVHVSGGVVGGHAILCNRISLSGQFFGLSNSWGPGWGTHDQWGLGGTARISFADMKKVLRQQDAEVCVPLKRAMG